MTKWELFLEECKLYNPNILSGYNLIKADDKKIIYQKQESLLHINMRVDGRVSIRITSIDKNSTLFSAPALCPTKFVDLVK